MTVLGESKVPKYFKDVVESGLYDRLRAEEIHQKYLRRKPVIKEDHLGVGRLDGAILTLFIVCGGTMLLALLVSLWETRHMAILLITYFYNFCSQTNTISIF